MESFIFALNAVAPIVLMIAIGYMLKRLGFINSDFAGSANRIVFRVFLPAMLFLNVYKIDIGKSLDLTYIVYVFAVILALFIIAFPLSGIFTKRREGRGVIMQAAFRSNYALIGIPLAQSLFDDEGVIVATLLSALVIPLFNILAVICLSVYGEGKPSLKKIILDILKNPLIQSIALGGMVLLVRYIFTKTGVELRLENIDPIYKVLEYLSRAATPLALIVLGAQFEFSKISELRREILCGTLMRALIVPLIGLGIAVLFFRDHFSGAHFASFVAVFTTPLAVSSVAMAQEMKADSILAGQLVIWTTLFSAFSTFIASMLLKLIGIF